MKKIAISICKSFAKWIVNQLEQNLTICLKNADMNREYNDDMKQWYLAKADAYTTAIELVNSSVDPYLTYHNKEDLTNGEE